MPTGYIIFDSRENAFGRLIKLREEIVRASGVNKIMFTEVNGPGKEDLYRVGTRDDRMENVRAALDIIKEEAMVLGSSVGK